MLNSSPSTHLPLSPGLTALMWSSDKSQLMLSGHGTIALQGKRRLALSHRSRLELRMPRTRAVSWHGSSHSTAPLDAPL